MIGAPCRAGGGGHGGHGSSGSHGASGGHGSGGSHSGGSGGDVSFGGLLALVVILFIVWLLVRRYARGRSAGAPFSADPAFIAAPAMPPTPGLGVVAAIRTADPEFEIESFLQRVEMTFFLVKRGIQNNDAAAIRPYLNDAVFGAVSREIEGMAAQHRRVVLESLNIRHVHLLDGSLGEVEQRLRVHFDLVYRAKTLDDANRVLADEGEDGRHGESWTFVRAAAARTPADGGVTAWRCPACGAELRLGLDGVCAHCGASVVNGSVDWVVADVQPAPYLGFADDATRGVAAPTVAEGIATLRAADAAFDLNAFLTRVNTAFMALQAAWCRQDLDAGRAFLSPGAYFGWRAQLEIMAAEGRRDVMERLAVRRIEPVQVIHGRVFDDLTVRIAAESADFEVDAAGRMVFGDRAVRPFVEQWTFQRSVGTTTRDKPGTLESTCPGCGAPLALTQIGECRYCRAAVTSGRFDWVVSRIEQADEGQDR